MNFQYYAIVEQAMKCTNITRSSRGMHKAFMPGIKNV